MAKKILVVDDEPDVLKVTMFRLKKIGYEVQSAVNGRQALDLIKISRPDLILLDLRIPVIDGYEVCKQVKANDSLKDIPVILFTASDPSRMAQNIKALKAEDYIIKPFEAEELLGKIKKLID